MKKIKKAFIISGLLLTIVPFFINIYSIFRLLSVLIGIIIFLLGITINEKNIILRVLFFPLITCIVVYGMDYLSAKIFKTYPIISIKIESSKNMKVYNGILYRVFECEDIKTVDENYESSFICNKETLKINSVNTFLSNPKNTYKKYYGKFVRIQGKVTKIVGTTELTLNSFSSEPGLNGYVEFDQNKMLVLDNLNIDPVNYRIYDNIEVIGIVSKYEEDGDVIKIHLDNVKILATSLYDNYEVLVNDISDKSIVKKDDGIYYMGIEGIYYKYDENNIYTIDYLLKDKRILLEDLIKNITPSIVNDEDELYELELYNIIICKNDDLVFASKKIKKYDKACMREE